MTKTINIIIIAVVFLVSAFALATTAEANVGGFSVTPNFPENQNPDSRGFFDLRVTPGQRQELSVTVNNPNDEPITVTINLVTANTNMNGIINYSSTGNLDETLEHSFADMAHMQVDNTVTIPPNTRGTVPIFVDIPDTGFDGVILGSIHVLLEISDEERAAAGMIVNRFANAIVVRLQASDHIPAADFELGDVSAQIVANRAAVVAEVRNIQPRLSMGAIAHAQIYPVGSSTPVFSRSNVEVDFAPNTVFPFTMIDEAGFGLHPGNYLARIQIELDGRSWEFEREFEILPAEAAGINETAVNIQQQMPMGAARLGLLPMWIMIAIGGGIVLLIVIIIILITKSRNSKKAYAEFQQRMQQLEMRQQPQGQFSQTMRQTSDRPVQQPDRPAKQAEARDKQKALEQLQQMDQADLMRLMQQLQQDQNKDD